MKTLNKKPEISELKVLGEAFWNIVKHYAFTREEQCVLLGIKYNRQRIKDLNDNFLIPDDVDKINRVGLLLGIHKNLRIMYPNNREIVYRWMKYPQIILDGKIPIEFIMEDVGNSFWRLAYIRRKLDYVRCSR